jgi:DNA-binding MarR family transcriptional regulator
MQHYTLLPGLLSSGLVKAPQITLLALLNDNNAGTAHTELVRLTTLSPAHVSTCLSQLETGMLIEKRYPARDGRTINIYLTESGKKKALVMLASMSQNVAEQAATQET